jgi:scavenger receptor class B, member 1
LIQKFQNLVVNPSNFQYIFFLFIFFPLLQPPFDKFGWFVDRNDSYTYDGNFTMFTGETDINKLGVLELWNDKNKTHLYRGACDNVLGTSGELWPPIPENTKPPLTVFATDVCRAVTVKYDSEDEKFGIKGYKWVGDDSVFDNGKKYPEMACYCSADEESCPDLLPGLFNASSCKFGAPAFVSFPHFYLADKHYVDSVEGLNPKKEDHEFSVSMEPRTGIPLNVRAQLQINLLMKSYAWTPFKNIKETMMPMFWFRQVAELTEDLAGQAKIAVMLPDIGVWFAYALAGLGGLLVLLGVYCFAYRWRQVAEDEEILS